MSNLRLHFLGTGGGRFVMVSQTRRTGGLRIIHDDVQIHIDPGPGALVFSNWAGLSPQRLNAVIVTHCHPDHYGDAEVFIEAMSHGTKQRRGIIAAPRSVLYGSETCGPSISAYHQKLVESVELLRSNASLHIGNLKITAVEARHSDPDTVGLRIETPSLGSVGYTSDTGYFPELGGLYRDLRLLILCTMRPRSQPLEFHLSTDEALEVIRAAQPKCAVLTHFGMMMLKVNPETEAKYLEDETGVPTISARDGLEIALNKSIEASGPGKKAPPRIIET
ncbi:MBL fold metallo-hydrolase [Candidatus Bathyarchaeota archaeon]|nr:MBL fold metallo-hydrolase [Candidatus Bathyarchaeota archaeon]MBS7631461.1 MBL fold metallo-hydrolase [Candidatus Bathyarchaeota archaeon]